MTSEQRAMKCVGSPQYEHNLGRRDDGDERDMGRSGTGGKSRCEVENDCNETRCASFLMASASTVNDGSQGAGTGIAGAGADAGADRNEGDMDVEYALTRTKSMASRMASRG